MGTTNKLELAVDPSVVEETNTCGTQVPGSAQPWVSVPALCATNPAAQIGGTGATQLVGVVLEEVGCVGDGLHTGGSGQLNISLPPGDG
ncbi:MAG TPA: hypothetical protein VN495_01160, partial [Candidatus Paceibacterota bacterium]|nr:hypothetical protein [Candidatus Paceibacterota bacterium]